MSVDTVQDPGTPATRSLARGLATGALLLLVTGLPACRSSRPATLTPPRLAGLPCTRVEEGETARRSIGALHGKEVAPLASAIADYGEGRLILYASRFDGPGAAEAALASMLQRLGAGTTPFAAPVAHPSRAGIWLTKGPGGHHALFSRGDRLLWLQGEPQLVDRACGEL